jgi:hypothetical protein
MTTPQTRGGIGLARCDILGSIPVQKGALDSGHIAPAREVMAVPTVLGPQGIEGLGRPVVVGLALEAISKRTFHGQNQEFISKRETV